MSDPINLCEELIKAFNKVQINENIIAKVKNEKYFIDAESKPDSIQKTLLTMVLYNLLLRTEKDIPVRVRMALSAANSCLSWLEDVVTTILPFIKDNESEFL